MIAGDFAREFARPTTDIFSKIVYDTIAMTDASIEDRALRDLLTQIQRETGSLPLSKLTTVQIKQIALSTARFAQSLLCQNVEEHMSREAALEDLLSKHIAQICAMASSFEQKQITDAAEALSILRKRGFEVRKFVGMCFLPDDPRLQEAPNEWLFKQVESGALPPNATNPEDSLMICEIRPKPDVHCDECWIQEPYQDDPFADDLALLHAKLDGDKTEKRVQPRSRAGFTFYELQQHVLPALSRKAGVRFACMSAIHACMLANDHPRISAGRSTEWRGDTIGESHAVISGRSDRGPIRYVYYDVMSDPYINRGFRLCVPLSISSDTEPSS